MTRAVIELSGDVLSALPELSRRIEGSYYHPTIPSLAFRFEDLWVIVEKDKINVYNIVDEAKIGVFLDWFKNIINNTGKTPEIQED